MEKVIIEKTEYEIIPVTFDGVNYKAILTKGTYLFGSGLCIRLWVAYPEEKTVDFWEELSINPFPKALKNNQAAICRFNEGAEMVNKLLDTVGAVKVSNMMRINDMDVYIYDFSKANIKTQEKEIDRTTNIIFFNETIS